MMGTRHIRRRYTRDTPPGISEQHAYSYWCQPVFHSVEFPTACLMKSIKGGRLGPNFLIQIKERGPKAKHDLQKLKQYI
jgi:hypothetical protein